MTVDRPAESQYPALRSLWQQAFGDPDVFLDGFFATGFSPDRCRCIRWNDRLAAALYWFDCRWQGKKLAYIYAVATEADFRGKGFCRSLMEDTHAHLKKLGYAGAVLVPGSRELFGMYEKLGYRGFSPKLWQELPAAEPAVPIRALTAEEFAEKRPTFLPEGGVLQEGATLAYLSTFAGFYEADDCLFCGGGEEIFLFQEFLGDEKKIPGILAALQGKQGRVPCPGQGPDSAMYYPLTDEEEIPAYFGLALN